MNFVINIFNPAQRNIVMLTMRIFFEFDGVGTFHMVNDAELAVL